MYNVADKSVVNTVNQNGGNYSVKFSTTESGVCTQARAVVSFQKTVFNKGLNLISPLSTDHNKNKVLYI